MSAAKFTTQRMDYFTETMSLKIKINMNLHWELRTEWQKQKHREDTKKFEEKCAGARWRCVTRHGGLSRSYGNLLSEVFCVVSFFFLFIFFTFSHIKKHQKMKNIIKDWMKTVYFRAVGTALKKHLRNAATTRVCVRSTGGRLVLSLPC